VFLVELDPTRGRKIQKTRPCLVVSPDELNHYLHTVVVAPMTTGGHLSPFRVKCQFGGKRGRIVLDQIRTIDRERLRKKLGAVSSAALASALHVLTEMFEV
jgi:mRNA interferase MazF